MPSPALFNKIGLAFRKAVTSFASVNDIPLIRFTKADRKIDRDPPLPRRGHGAGGGGDRDGPGVPVGVHRPRPTAGQPGPPRSPSSRPIAGSRFYFYIWDAEFGPGFIKLCTYFPYPAKVWLNGHEWAKQQATTAGIGFSELANGFGSCDDPAALQAICDRLGPTDIEAFFERWMAVIPTPLDAADRAAGYWWELSMRQIETSRTIVFDQPRRARGFFEAVVADNIGYRPALGGEGHLRTQIHTNTKGEFRTRVVTRGIDVCIDVILQEVADQAVLEGGTGAAHRDRDQRPRRSRLPTPPPQPRRAPSQGPRRQRPAARRPTCRPGLCHLDAAVRTGHTALAPGGPTSLRAALRRPPRHGPGRRPLCAGAPVVGFTNRSLCAR